MDIKKIISIFLGVVAVIMISLGVYMMNSSKYIFETVLNNTFNILTNKYIETELLDSDKFKLSSNNKVTMSTGELSTADGEFYADVQNLKFYLDFNSTNMGEDYISLQGLIQDEKLYLKFKEVIDKFYYENIEISEAINEIDYKQIKLSDTEIKLLMGYLKNSILVDLSDKDFEKSSETIKVENKNYKTTKISLPITQKRLVKMMETLLTSITNDNKAIQVLQKLDKTITKNEIQELLQNIKEIASDATDEEMFKFSIYVEGLGELRRVELTLGSNTSEDNELEVGFRFDLVNNQHNQKTYLASVYEGETVEAMFKIEYITNTNANLLLNIDSIKIEGTIDNNDNVQKVKLKIISDEENLGTLDYTYAIVKEDKEYKIDIVVDIPSIMTFESNNNLLFDEPFPNIDVTNAVAIEEMTEDEEEKIVEYFDSKYNSSDIFDDDESYENNESYDTSYYEVIKVDDVEELMKSRKPVVLWFGNPLCNHCAKLAESFEEAWWEYDAYIYYIDTMELEYSDTETLKSIDSKFDVSALPVTFILQNGKIKDVKEGSMTKDELFAFFDKNGVE